MERDFWSERAAEYSNEILAAAEKRLATDPYAERKKLEEALQFGTSALSQPNSWRTGESMVFINREGLRYLVDAARKHLETLPKPPRLVETWHVEYAYRRDGGAWTPRVLLFTNEREAEVAARERRGPLPKWSRFREEYADIVITKHMRTVPA